MDNKKYENEENINAFQRINEEIIDEEKLNEEPEEVSDREVEEANDIINLDENTADRG